MSTDPFSLLPCGAVQQRAYPQGSVVFRQGATTSGLYRVCEGAVIMQRVSTGGDAVVVRKATTGDVFAEASLFTSHYHCDAVCVETSTVESVSKSAVLKALASNPEFSYYFCELMAHSIHQARQAIELLALSSAEERVLAAIQLGLMTGTIAELAHRIGLTQATCYRSLSSLTKTGKLIKHGRGQYRLRDT